MFQEEYDVTVVGAGHAVLRLRQAAILVQNPIGNDEPYKNIAQMSCNPAMGGIAKGQSVREIDVMGTWHCLRQDGYPIQDVEQIKRACDVVAKSSK
jgi:tRNA uridine 5-carboxymethylaminomethyl modification enzyme